MKVYYVIEDITSPGSFWSNRYRAFKGWLYADKFDENQDAIDSIDINNVGVCKVTKVYDSK